MQETMKNARLRVFHFVVFVRATVLWLWLAAWWSGTV